MKKYSILLVFLLSVTALGSAWAAPSAASKAQTDSLNRDVTVEKAYNPTLMQARKMSPVPVKEEYKNEPPQLQYTTWSKVEDVTPVPEILKPISYEPAANVNHKKGLFKLGLGFYWQTLGEFYYPLLKGDKYLLDLSIGHHSNWSHIDLDDGTSPRGATHQTDVALNFETQFERSRLAVHADYLYKGFDYYGMSTALEDSLKNTMSGYSKFDFGMNWFSTDVHQPIEYEVGVGYRYFGRDMEISQHQVEIEAEVSGELSTGRLGGEIAADVHFLDMQGAITGHPLHTVGVLTLTPFYEVGGKEWGVRVGGNLFVHMGQDVMWPVTGSADIDAHVALVPELFYLYAGIGGDFSTNDYYSMIEENPYITPTLSMQPTYTPLDMNLDLKVRIMKGLLFDIGANYEILLNQYYYVNHVVEPAVGAMTDPATEPTYTNTFDVVYENTTHHLDVEAGLYFDYVPGLNISAVGKYHLWSVRDNAFAWNKPAWEALLDANYTFLEKFQVGLSYHFQGARMALVGNEALRMTDVHDLNLYFSYQALDWLTVFANGKNLINIKSDSFYGYRNFGINAMIGVNFSF